MTSENNKVALIIGGGQIPGETIGNGRATALTFAKEGAKIVIADIDINLAEETARLIQDQGVKLLQLKEILLIRKIVVVLYQKQSSLMVD